VVQEAEMTKGKRDDHNRYRTVECWNEQTGSWDENARRVTPATAAAIAANLESFGHKARIISNRYFAGVFGPTLERE
jgi:hypothetical protein